MDRPQTAPHAPLAPSNIFRLHLHERSWHWTYHDRQGRLLVRGPEDSDRWTAHCGLLDAIADYCTRGEAEEEEEDEPVAIETATLHAGAAASADAPGTCPAALEPRLGHGDRKSA